MKKPVDALAPRAALLLALVVACSACRSASTPGTLDVPPPSRAPAPLPVAKAVSAVVVTAWAEPPRLRSGGQAHIMVRVRDAGGEPAAGVEVRLSVSGGSLFSKGRLLTTNASGMTRDRLTARGHATITVNAGGTLHRLSVPTLRRGD